MQDLDAAAKAYTRCLESNPSFLAAYIGRGDVYADAGDYDAAKQQYMLALEQNPDCVEAIVHLGYNLQVIQVICCCVVKKLIYYNLFLY